jgi:hypothetical protein
MTWNTKTTAVFLLGVPVQTFVLTAVVQARAAQGVGKQEYGWVCEVRDGSGVKIYRVKGTGSKRKRDVVCE